LLLVIIEHQNQDQTNSEVIDIRLDMFGRLILLHEYVLMIEAILGVEYTQIDLIK